ncbi:MAG: hypothetical protein LQ352_005387 [Teloschistes flavicans]|nr:MAG: hypothetical protein LQ352_005387 [Teloschistes flavicans]
MERLKDDMKSFKDNMGWFKDNTELVKSDGGKPQQEPSDVKSNKTIATMAYIGKLFFQTVTKAPVISSLYGVFASILVGYPAEEILKTDNDRYIHRWNSNPIEEIVDAKKSLEIGGNQLLLDSGSFNTEQTAA